MQTVSFCRGHGQSVTADLGHVVVHDRGNEQAWEDVSSEGKSGPTSERGVPGSVPVSSHSLLGYFTLGFVDKLSS